MHTAFAILAFAATGFAIDAKFLADRAPEAGAVVTQISDGQIQAPTYGAQTPVTSAVAATTTVVAPVPVTTSAVAPPPPPAYTSVVAPPPVTSAVAPPPPPPVTSAVVVSPAPVIPSSAPVAPVPVVSTTVVAPVVAPYPSTGGLTSIVTQSKPQYTPTQSVATAAATTTAAPAYTGAAVPMAVQNGLVGAFAAGLVALLV